MDGEPIDPEQGPKQLDAETLAIIQEARAMDPADRMLGLRAFGLAEQILKLDGEMERQRRQEQPAALPSEDKTQP